MGSENNQTKLCLKTYNKEFLKLDQPHTKTNI